MIDIQEYYEWAYGDLTDHHNRDIFAKYLVASALGIDKTVRIKSRWSYGYDILYKWRDTVPAWRIDIKSAAYADSDDGNFPENISFRVSPDDHSHCDIYVFCVFTAIQIDEDPRNLDLWDFYVLPKSAVDEQQPAGKTITMNRVHRMKPVKCGYADVRNTIHELMGGIQ